MSNNFNKNRIVKNSAVLYLRMLITMWFNLWGTRLVLHNLGIENMGVYGVVGSVVGLFSVFASGITPAVQRFITFEIGKKDGQPNSIFCSSLNVIFIMSFLLFLLLEIVGVWFLKTSVKIPKGSEDAAFWVYQLSVITSIVSLISVPYNALIIAHERMSAYAYISIVQVLLNWASAYCLSLIPQNKRLLYYGLALAAISILVQILYQAYTRFKFPESKYHLLIDRQLIKKIGKFTGISTLSNIIATVSGQGFIFVINWTFGVAINAVYSIALQLKNSVLSFGLNIGKAIVPQITKTYADGEFDKCEKLVYSGSKAEFFMILFIFVPFMFKTEYIIHLWLGKTPNYICFYTRCTIFLSLIYAFFEPFRAAVYATGKISKFVTIPESFYLVTVLPLSYIVSKITKDPRSLILTAVILDILSSVIRIYIGSKVSKISLKDIGIKVLLPCISVTILSSVVCYFLSQWFRDNLWNLLLFLTINSILLCVIIYYIGLSKQERNTIRIMITNKVFNLKHN